jgi:glycosyltransferase involved in cell wall biosynthesis
MNPCLLVNGNFVPTNGMDMPNLALARFLAERGTEVHLVTHRAEEALTSKPNVIVHHVPKPANSYLLAAPFLDRMGRKWAAHITARRGDVVANGGNCLWGDDINWVHYVHAAYRAPRAGNALRIAKNECAHRTFRAMERKAVKRARIVIANSERTKRDIVEHLGVSEERVQTVYYGIDRERFRPPTSEERERAQLKLGWSNERPVVAFIGALGDRRKGLDKVLAAWESLCADVRWDADLAVVGAGGELPAYQARVRAANLESRVHFLGFRDDVPTILAASDALIAPTRYEAYGQGVHEALCCGVPALVTAKAGVAERYPAELQDLLIPDPEDVDDLRERLRAWRNRADEYRAMVLPLSEQLRAHTWEQMAAQIVSVARIAA